MRHLVFLALLLAFGSPLSAQVVEVSGAEADSSAIRLRAILDRGSYLLLDRDTTLGSTSRIDGDLVVANARVNLEGTVTGSIAVLPGELFIRPGATVGGEVIELGGRAYPSGLAQMGEIIALDPRVTVTVARTPTAYRLTLTEPLPPGVLRMPAGYGVRLPTYDRVSGLTLAWGTELGLGGDTSTIALIGNVSYAIERERVGGGVELRVRPSPRGFISLRASREARTQDGWARDDLSNSASSLAIRSDLRNYYESDEVLFTIGQAPPPPLIQGEGFVAPRVGLRLAEDRSLVAGDPWSLFRRDEAWRFNPAVDDGRMASAFAGATAGWRGVAAAFSGAAAVEWSPSGVGDFDFAQVTATGAWNMISLYGHQIETSGYLLLPITGSVPRQRWSILGGGGTLPTFNTGAMRGDHLLFIRSAYIAPIRWLPLPVVGPPSLRLEHRAGSAWRSPDPMPSLEQNVGAGLQFLFFEAMLHFDPAERPRRAVFSFSASLPVAGSSGVF